MAKWLRLGFGEPLLEGHSMWEIYGKRYLINLPSFSVNDLAEFVTRVTEAKDFIVIAEDELLITIYACDPKQWSGRKMGKMRKQLGLKRLVTRNRSEKPKEEAPTRVFRLEPGQQWRIQFLYTSASTVCELWPPILNGHMTFCSSEEAEYFQKVAMTEKFDKGRNHFDVTIHDPGAFYSLLGFLQGRLVMAEYLP